jgi:hypothetical protein
MEQACSQPRFSLVPATAFIFINLKREAIVSQVLVVHACNPSYSGGKDQEYHSLKPAWANSL